MFRDVHSSKGIVVAQVYDLKSATGASFPTSAESSFQFGYRLVEEDLNLQAHIHKRVRREVDNTSEFLFVLKGEMVIDIYCEEEQFVEKVILRDQMGLLQFEGGHKIEIAADTKFFELKQGPYLGKDYDKYQIKV